jgi:hypothetical protein
MQQRHWHAAASCRTVVDVRGYASVLIVLFLFGLDMHATEALQTSRPVEDWFEAQVVLHRLGFSCGGIDGIPGPKTEATLTAFQ